jgi:hypothetical protein
MAAIYQSELIDLSKLVICDPSAEIVLWQGRKALKLNGLAVIPDFTITEGRIEVQIGVDGAAYPGIAFRIQDVLNFELAYAQPHTSGSWDALQYDPVFHGSNTWQLYHGKAFQKSTNVPSRSCFNFSVEFKDNLASVRIGEQDPLFVSKLAHTHDKGWIGIWSYLPSYFCDLRVYQQPISLATNSTEVLPEISSNTIMEWFAEGFGKLECESTGILNLNRFFSTSAGEIKLVRWFETFTKEEVEIVFGFSDMLTLKVDDMTIFSGENLYKSSPDWGDRGYVEQARHVRHWVNPGRHQLTAFLSATELFGWGLILEMSGSQSQLLPIY